MTYWALNAVFLAAVGVVVLAAALASSAARRREATGDRPRGAVGRRRPWRAIALTGVVVLAMTAVFDNVMIAVGLVGYDSDRISGAFVGIAPVEDFAYAVAAVILLPALWMLLPARRDRS